MVGNYFEEVENVENEVAFPNPDFWESHIEWTLVSLKNADGREGMRDGGVDLLVLFIAP